jgi:hypothetical protein
LEDSLTTQEKPAKDNDLELISAVKRFEEAEHVTRAARMLSERDRDYKDGKQHTAEEEAILQRRKQPVVTYNRILRKVNYLLGLERQTRKDPRAFPRTPNDEASAQAATDAIRFICDSSRWDDRRSEAADNLVVEGIGIVEVGVRETEHGLDPEIRHIPWDRFFYDPHSAAFDFADAAYKGMVIWMDRDDAVAKYPKAKDTIFETWSSGRDAETYDDRPKYNLWSDYGRKRVRVVQMYYKKSGVWHYCIFTQAGFLVDPAPSPYQGEDGQPECPLIAVSMYVDRDNNRYGEVRTMISPQDEVNKRRSKALHLMSMRQVRVGRGLEADINKIRGELAKPDGVVAADSDELEILNTSDMAAANLQMLQEAKAEIDLLGPNAALQGKNEQAQSGRAILAQQQGGMVEVAVYLDRIRCLSLETYRQVWNRIRQHWTSERWIRITDDQRNMKFVGLNKPVRAIDALAEQMGVTPENFAQFAQERPDEAAQLQMMAQSPQGQQVVRVENNVAQLGVDIVVDEGIDTPTVQAEQFDALVKALPALVNAPPAWVETLIEASSFRDKDKILERLKGGADGQPAPPSPQEQMAAQMQAAQAEAQMQGQIKLDAAKIAAAADIEIAQIKAQTDLVIADAKAEQDMQRVAVDDARKREADARKWEADARAKDEAEAKVALQPGPEGASMKALADALAMMAQAQMEGARPRRKIPVRDENGFIVEVREVPETEEMI